MAIIHQYLYESHKICTACLKLLYVSPDKTSKCYMPYFFLYKIKKIIIIKKYIKKLKKFVNLLFFVRNKNMLYGHVCYEN